MIELMLQAERALMVGMVDQAERLYLMASKNDPRNAIAVVGLARVALERNDDRAAYDLSRQALEIDPDNAAALRLEARLSEVLTHRGEAVERPAFVQPGGPGTRASDGPSRPSPSEEPFPPRRRASVNGEGEAIGTVMRTERHGWQPARMPDPVRPAAAAVDQRVAAAPPARPWAPPGWTTGTSPQDPSAGSTPVSVHVTESDEAKPETIRIWPRPGASRASPGPTRYAAVVDPEEPTPSEPATLPGGVPATAVGERPVSTDSPAAAATSEPPTPEPVRKSLLRRLFGR